MRVVDIEQEHQRMHQEVRQLCVPVFAWLLQVRFVFAAEAIAYFTRCAQQRICEHFAAIEAAEKEGCGGVAAEILDQLESEINDAYGYIGATIGAVMRDAHRHVDLYSSWPPEADVEKFCERCARAMYESRGDKLVDIVTLVAGGGGISNVTKLCRDCFLEAFPKTLRGLLEERLSEESTKH